MPRYVDRRPGRHSLLERGGVHLDELQEADVRPRHNFGVCTAQVGIRDEWEHRGKNLHPVEQERPVGPSNGHRILASG
jgi:hypothetical protein